MPALANITVKKADGTTDVIYTANQGASGDKVFARWTNSTVGTTPAERPQFTLKAESNGSGTARRLTASYKWPMVSTDAGGNKIVAGGFNGSATFLVPQNQEASVIAEQAAQFCNVLASTLVKASISEGFAPR